MPAGGYEYDEDEEKLKIDFMGSIYGASIEDYPAVMSQVIDRILEVKKVRAIVLTKDREYEYGPEQTSMLVEIAAVIEDAVRERLLSRIRVRDELQKRLQAETAARLQRIVLSLMRTDPIGAYAELVREIRRTRIDKRETRSPSAFDFYTEYESSVLAVLLRKLEATKLIKLAKPHIAGYHLGDRALYREIFVPSIRPNFMLTRYMITPPEKGKSVARYKLGDADVEIFKLPDTTQYFYYVLPPEFILTEEKYAVLDAARRYMATHKPRSAEFVKTGKIRDVFYNIGRDMIREVADQQKIFLSNKDLEQLAMILTRYTAGLGVLELLLADEKIQDIYVNSPVESQPILINHSDFEECRTNLIPTQDDAESWATRLRMQSGRPLDEANPVLDTDIEVPGGKARFCIITRTLSPQGLGFSIRRHRDKPWTLPLFIRAKMLDPLAAGLLSFLIDGTASLLVAGGRGAGKTSVLSAMMLEMLPKTRIVTLEDTLELPINQLRDLQFNIESLKSRSVLTMIETEMPSDEALRTALRLGDSALVIGEVRSSIRGNEEVVVVDDGDMKRIQIKELENMDLSRMAVPTLGLDLRVKLSKLTDLVKHPKRRRLLQVKTATGREVTVTPDHSLFTATNDFRIAPIECKDLRAGDQLVIPGQMPCGFNDIDVINVFDFLPDFRVANFEDDVRRSIKVIGWKKATEICSIRCGDVYNYFRTNQKTNMPFTSFTGLMDAAGLDYDMEGLDVRSGSSLPLPAQIPVDGDFCRFLGYYVSEGYYSMKERNGGIVVITNSNQDIIDDIARISRRIFNLMPSTRIVKGIGESCQSQFSCYPLTKLISKLGCGRTSAEKRVPPMIFGLSKEKIAEFLRGLYSGDGSFTSSRGSGNSVRYYSTSRKLVEDVSYLLLQFGIVARIREASARKPENNRLWMLEFKDREMVETFMEEICFTRKVSKMIVRKWPHTKSSMVHFDRDALEKHLMKHPRRYRHLFRFQRCSKNYLRRVALDKECILSERMRDFALGEFFLDEVKEIKEIQLEEREHVYDLSVEPSQNFIGGFGGVLLHNTEAKALYEAMRIGALSNVVVGTIHGESAFGVFDRVVNDLGVPMTSFKATDIIPICKSLRSADGLHRFRRMTEITEVRKKWEKNPDREGGFVNLMEYSAKEDAMKPTDTLVNGESETLNRIASYVREWHGDWSSVWDNINLRARIKKAMVDVAAQTSRPDLLEAEWVVRSNTQFHILCESVRKEVGSIDSARVMEEWLRWFRDSMK